MNVNVIKRSGEEVVFDIAKIENAITKAHEATKDSPLDASKIKEIAALVAEQCISLKRSVEVEEIQDMVENELMNVGAYLVAKNYITYRYKR